MRSPVASLLAKLFTPVEKHQLLLLSVVTIIIAVLLLNIANTYETVPFFNY
jgi:cell division protein FtsL